MSHGNLASALIEAAKMVLGDLSNYDAIDMKTEDTFVEVEEKLKNLLEQYKDK
ncbi:PTS sugar transporter subunit IIA, partial [Brachyspira pulli]